MNAVQTEDEIPISAPMTTQELADTFCEGIGAYQGHQLFGIFSRGHLLRGQVYLRERCARNALAHRNLAWLLYSCVPGETVTSARFQTFWSQWYTDKAARALGAKQALERGLVTISPVMEQHIARLD